MLGAGGGTGRTIAMWWVRLSACTAMACAGHSDQPPGEPERSGADKYYDVAVGSFHNGLFEDAKVQLDRALRDDPKHADSHYLRGVLFLQEGKAIVDSIEIEQCLVDAAADQQRERAEELHLASEAAFSAAVKGYPEDGAGRGRALNSLAVVALFFQRYEDAIEHSRAALGVQFYTDRYSALSNLGWAHYKQGDLVSATAELRQAIMLNPEYCVGHYRLSQVYLENGLVEQALEHAGTVARNERCPIQDAHRIEGVAFRRLAREEEASAALVGCIEVAPKSCLSEDCRQLLGPEWASRLPNGDHG